MSIAVDVISKQSTDYLSKLITRGIQSHRIPGSDAAGVQAKIASFTKISGWRRRMASYARFFKDLRDATGRSALVLPTDRGWSG
ncbi:hypothetical protein [Mycobacterium aquaticum]|uniref:hypothetical protein n=1 Tax=Mycobacterium aquaticum TaxID=1927124 RepID=UPI0011504BDD|nr:hypothetical protein [Mycobacterium aquaticum]